MSHSGPNVDDAIHAIVNYARRGLTGPYPGYGYGIYLPNIIRTYLAESGVPQNEVEQRIAPASPAFYAGAWELCRRGILRPGIKRHGLQVTEDGASGNGYSVTPYGETWLQAAVEHEYLPSEPGRFARLLADAGARFGAGFVERSQQAVAAYSAHAFLAACAMCGAAAESVSLALAIAKKGSEKAILDMYAAASGRSRVEAFLLGAQPATVREEFRRYTDLLKYWRDHSAHGRAVNITEPEAYQALGLLLRFTLFARDRFDGLTRGSGDSS